MTPEESAATAIVAALILSLNKAFVCECRKPFICEREGDSSATKHHFVPNSQRIAG
jgi:hypothetical protein